jgi:hypothetical protein
MDYYDSFRKNEYWDERLNEIMRMYIYTPNDIGWIVSKELNEKNETNKNI